MSDDARGRGASAWDDVSPLPQDDGSFTVDCGCAPGCACGCMDWADLDALGPVIEAGQHGGFGGALPSLGTGPLFTPSLFSRPLAPPPPPPRAPPPPQHVHLLAAVAGAAGGALARSDAHPPLLAPGGAASGAVVAQQPSLALAFSPGATSVRTRCINEAHPPGCARCAPPPPPDEDCELVGDVGKKARGGTEKGTTKFRFVAVSLSRPVYPSSSA